MLHHNIKTHKDYFIYYHIGFVLLKKMKGNKMTSLVAQHSETPLSVASSENPSISTRSGIAQIHDLLGKWDLYYHLPQNKNWDLASYKLILGDIDTADKLVAIGDALTQNIMKYCMLFVMRSGITPMWEDPKNRNGGFFSYKVANKFVPDVWKTMFYALCGETLSTNQKYSHLINGITVSPKKSFCIIKIWMVDMSMQDGSVIIDIPNLTKHGVAFKPHKPEF